MGNPHTTNNMFRLSFLLALVAMVSADPGMKAKIMKMINKHNFDCRCWGKDNVMKYHEAKMSSLKSCMGEEPSKTSIPMPRPLFQQPLFQPLIQPLSMGSLNHQYSVLPLHHTYHHSIGKRSAMKDDMAEFINDWYDFRGNMEDKIGNLTCVFKKMEIISDTGDININLYQGQLWDSLNLETTLAGSDPAWRNMLTTKYTDCYNKANSLSVETLTRHPLIKDVQLARNMQFWKCALQAETECCAAAMLDSWVTDMKGENMESMKDMDNTDNMENMENMEKMEKMEDISWAEYGLPENRYERAAVGAMVMIESLNPVEELVCSVMSSDGEDLF